MFRLKKGIEGFTVTDGDLAGRSYEKGRVYHEIPPQEAGKFEKITEPAPPAAIEKPAKAEKLKAVTVSELSESKEV